MSSDLATAPPFESMAANLRPGARLAALHTVTALIRAGFRRYATYRQATAAACFTNTVFGFLRCYVLLAVAAGAGRLAGGYDRTQLVSYAWVSQGLIGIVLLWGWTDLADRIRSGDVVSDLLRPIHPVTSYLAVDLGRAGFAALTRFVVPIAVGAVFFHLYAPHALATYPLFVLSVLLAVVVSFCCRYLVNACAFWLLDIRGVNVLWTFASGLLTGLVVPLHFLPGWVAATLWVGTPLPSILQAPLDVLVERGPIGARLAVVAGQAAWAGVLLAGCGYVQRRAVRRLVVQGG